jgi:lipopolysaccharide transport system ATP-binding protein
MGSIRQLCGKGMLLGNGEIVFTGIAEATIKNYMSNAATNNAGIAAIGTLTDIIKIGSVAVNNIPLDLAIMPQDEIEVAVKYECSKYLPAFRMSFSLLKDGVLVFTMQDLEDCEPIEPGRYQSKIKIRNYLLRPGVYTVSVGGHNANHTNQSIGNVEWFFATDVSSFEVLENWSINYDFNNIGLINLPNSGTRTRL